MSDETSQQPAAVTTAPYPVTFEFAGPEQLSKLSTGFRIILVIPLLLFLAVLSGGFEAPRTGTHARDFLLIGGGVFGGLLGAYWISAFVRGGRPVGWLGSVIVALQRFQLRAYTYILLLTDKYPAFEGDWYATYEAERPDRISRWQIFFWKTLTAIPHFIVLAALAFAVIVCEVIAWFAILFTGKFPQGMRDFVVGWLRWSARVTAYWISLRDEFPPYSMSAEAGPASKEAQRWSAVGGAATILAAGAIVAAVFLALGGSKTAHVSYASLKQGAAESSISVADVTFTVWSADDSYTFPDGLLVPDEGDRFVRFDIQLHNGRVASVEVEEDDFKLRDSDGHKHAPVFLSLDGELLPKTIKKDGTGAVTAIFQVPRDQQPEKLTYKPPTSLKDAELILD